MKVYMMTDLEGVAGVWDWDNRGEPTMPAYEEMLRSRRLLTGEVNAAVAGFFDGGATEVIVNDGHGAGYTIDIEDVDPRARVIHGQERPFWLARLDASCAATALVGAHAKAGTDGANLCHTMSHTTVADYSVNGVSMGETGLQALIAGHYGVPFIFLSGDEYACREVEELIPGVGTVATKTGLSRRSACTLSPHEARSRIRQGARDAMGLIGTVEPLKLDRPLVFRERRIQPDVDPEDATGGWRRISEYEREIEAADVIELMCLMYGYSPPR